MGLILRVANCNWVDGREVQILGPTSKGRQVLRGHQKRTINIREPLEVFYQSRGTSLTDGQKGRPLGGRELLIAELPNSTEAIPRMSSRTTVESGARGPLHHLLIGMDRIAIWWTSSMWEDYPCFFFLEK